MIGFLALLFPFVLLGFMLFMGRVEEPLRRVTTQRDVEAFLDRANPAELNAFVAEGTDSGLRRLRSRLLHRRRRPAATASASDTAAPDAVRDERA